MVDFLSFWYLLPLGIIIATIYTSTGISGANFWAPVYLLLIRLDPLVGFWLSLVTMLFGSVSGIIGHSRHKTINYYLAKRYLIATVPFAIIGALLLQFLNVTFLFLLFGSFVLSYGLYFLYNTAIGKEKINTHEKIHYLLGAIGGFLVGLISVGLGKIILPYCIKHKRVNHHSEAVGTTLVIVFITSLFAVLVRLNPNFINSLSNNFQIIASIGVYVIPGVILGGQLGPVLAGKLNLKLLKIYVSVLMIIIGILMFLRFGIFFKPE